MSRREEVLARLAAYEQAYREGYWNNASNDYPMYAIPVHSDVEPANKQQILDALDKLEASDELKPWTMRFMGFSVCRCCGQYNGVAEYYSERHGIRWPIGFRHYIDIHNITPSDKFLAMLDNRQ